MAKQKDSGQAVVATPFVSYCDYCASRIAFTYVLEDVDKPRLAHCSNCGNYTQTLSYKMGLSHKQYEYRRRRQYAKDKQVASGERGRAERRSTSGKAV